MEEQERRGPVGAALARVRELNDRLTPTQKMALSGLAVVLILGIAVAIWFANVFVNLFNPISSLVLSLSLGLMLRLSCTYPLFCVSQIAVTLLVERARRRCCTTTCYTRLFISDAISALRVFSNIVACATQL